jgi:HD superfamily phosphohydrolase
MANFEIIRDPLWDNIQLDDAAIAVLDTAPVQRLRYVRQLGHAFLVYPGATHTRFEHALGAYHLAGRAIAALQQRGELTSVSAEHQLAIRLAALLHDVGHYPFSHGLEEAGFPDHETLGVRRLAEEPLASTLAAIGGPDLGPEIGRLMKGRSESPLQGLISGSLDLDKIDYLSRDARACGVPYGTLDVDRLLSALTVADVGPGRRGVGVLEKGVSALETLLFAKYQMYRNVYWHHAVRAATCMFKRAVRAAVAGGALAAEQVANATDGALMERLFATDPTGLAQAVHQRRLYKRALDLPASDLPTEAGGWVAGDPDLAERVENALASEVGLRPAELLLDYPARDKMLGVDLVLRTREGRLEHLTDEGRAGHLGLPRIGAELYQSARRLRIFTARTPDRPLDRIVDVVVLPPEELVRRLDVGAPLLG